MQNKLVVANLCHRPVRTLLSLLAIGVEVCMILTMVGLSYGTLHGTARRARGVGADILIRPSGASLLILERTREIGILKALGASPGYILGLLFRESLAIAS